MSEGYARVRLPDLPYPASLLKNERIVVMHMSRRAGASELQLQVDRPDLDHVPGLDASLVAWVHAGPVDVRAVAAVQVLDRHLALLAVDDRVLPRRPDPLGRLLDL